MTGDAVVMLRLQYDAKTRSPLATLKAEAGSQHPDHPAATGIPRPQGPALADAPALPAHPASLHTTPKTQPLGLPLNLPDADPGGAAAPPPAPPPQDHAECAFCGLTGTPRTCGSLVAVVLGGQEAAVHHGCALWAPQVYQPQGCKDYLNLELEWRHSQGRGCRRCGVPGAAVTCTHAGCRAAYHLPCAVAAGNVGLDTASYELWCPRHAAGPADSDSEGAEARRGGYGARDGSGRRGGGADAEDDEFLPSGAGARPRRHAALSRRHRFQRGPGSGGGGGGTARDRAATAAAATAAALAVADRTQRPRTDWQRQGDTWVKVVPPWWCEHRTIHFANKVFRELFCGASSALLVDADGTEWDCAVACETRNDLRLQYTLRGAFHDFWDAAGVRAGDVLSFERNAPTAGPGRILVGRYPQGRGLEDALDVSGGASEAPALPPLPPAPPRAPRSAALPRRDSSLSEATTASAGAFFPPQQRLVYPPTAVPAFPALGGVSAPAGGSGGAGSSHPNRWADLPDGSAAKTVYKSTLAHQQCPVAGWLYRKLYGRLPADADSAPMTDPVLGADFAFEVTYVPAANVHYLGGRTFGAWLRQACVRSGDQIRVWRDLTGVKLCRMGPAGAAPPPISTFNALPGPVQSAAAVEGTPRATGVAAPAGPPSTGALAALNALAAAAGYAWQHGTPAIQAVLAAAGELRDAGAGANGEALALRLTAAGVPLPPSPFLPKKRKAECEDGIAPKRSSPAGGDGAAGALPPPPPPGQAAPTPPQLHHALQHLLRQFQAQQHQQAQAQRQGGAVPLPPLTLPQPLSTQPRPPLPPLNMPSTLPMPNPTLQQSQPPQIRPQQQQQQPGGASFGVVTAALARHVWSPSEAAALVQFRAKCAVADAAVREAAFTTVLQLQSDKDALLSFIRGFGAPEALAPAGTAPGPPRPAGAP